PAGECCFRKDTGGFALSSWLSLLCTGTGRQQNNVQIARQWRYCSLRSFPALPFMPEVHHFWMEHFSENFKRLDQAWPRALEELVAVRQKHPSSSHGAHGVP